MDKIRELGNFLAFVAVGVLVGFGGFILAAWLMGN